MEDRFVRNFLGSSKDGELTLKDSVQKTANNTIQQVRIKTINSFAVQLQ